MCQFLSLCSDGAGKVYYFDKALRQKAPPQYHDSHTAIAEHFGFKGKYEDMLNKYEWNPFTRVLEVDNMPNKNDKDLVLAFCKSLDITTVIPFLIIKDIVDPSQVAHGLPPNMDELMSRGMDCYVRFGKLTTEFYPGNVFAPPNGISNYIRHSIRYKVGYAISRELKSKTQYTLRNLCSKVCCPFCALQNAHAAYLSSFIQGYVWNRLLNENYADIWADPTDSDNPTSPFQPLVDLWEQGLLLSYHNEMFVLCHASTGNIVRTVEHAEFRKLIG